MLQFIFQFSAVGVYDEKLVEKKTVEGDSEIRESVTGVSSQKCSTRLLRGLGKPVQVAGTQVHSIPRVHGFQLLICMVGADRDAAAAVNLDPDGLFSAIGTGVLYRVHHSRIIFGTGDDECSGIPVLCDTTGEGIFRKEGETLFRKPGYSFSSSFFFAASYRAVLWVRISISFSSSTACFSSGVRLSGSQAGRSWSFR
jgi:hypothetical protein